MNLTPLHGITEKIPCVLLMEKYVGGKAVITFLYICPTAIFYQCQAICKQRGSLEHKGRKIDLLKTPFHKHLWALPINTGCYECSICQVSFSKNSNIYEDTVGKMEESIYISLF